MKIIEMRVSAGDRDIFEFDEFMSRPLFGHLAHSGPSGPCESPVWFYWDGQAIWIIGGTSFPGNLNRDVRCAFGIVDWNSTTGLLHHVGIRGTAQVVDFNADMARTIFRRYFGPNEESWDPRFNDVLSGQAELELVRLVPVTAVVRDQSYNCAAI